MHAARRFISSWYRLGLVAIVIWSLASARAEAAPIAFYDATGQWMNPVGGSNVSTGEFLGVDYAYWGGLNGYSGYLFLPGADIPSIAIGTPFVLGTFTHVNMPISDDAITAIDYGLSFNLTGVVPPISLTLNFLHDETNNDPATCFAGSVSMCDDIVTINLPTVPVVLPGTPAKSFQLLGFSKDGGATFASQYFSPELGVNTAMLYGLVSVDPAPIPNPEPATMVLFGTGLGAVVIAARRARRRNAAGDGSPESGRTPAR